MTQQFYPGVFPQEKWKHISQKDLCKNVHNSPQLETVQVSTNKEMKEQSVV